MLPENPDELLEWDLNKLWNALNQTEETKQKTKDKAKNGIKLTIPVWYITQEWYNINPSTKTVRILGHGTYKIEDFMQEIEDRKKIIIQELLELMENEGAIEPRGD